MTTQTTSGKRYQVLAVNDDESFCECCGKSGLERVVWIQDNETGDIRHFGTTCATKPAKGFDAKREIESAIRTWKQKMEHRLRLARHLYKQLGGKYVSDGIPLHLGGGVVVENQSLFGLCLDEVSKQ